MDAERYIEAWRERWRRQAEQDAEQARLARETAERLARLLVERYGARKVLLAGSLARREFRQGSDIDLAAEGIPPGELFRAGAEAERVVGDTDVDRVALESASAGYREHVEREGIVLYAAREG